MKTKTLMMAALLMTTGLAMSVHAAGTGGSAGGSASGSMGGSSHGAGSAGAGTSIGTGVSAGGGSLGTNVNAGVGLNGASSAQPSGAIDDTNTTGSSSLSTQSDAAARINAPGRSGTVSGRRINTGSRLGVSGTSTVY